MKYQLTVDTPSDDVVQAIGGINWCSPWHMMPVAEPASIFNLWPLKFMALWATTVNGNSIFVLKIVNQIYTRAATTVYGLYDNQSSSMVVIMMQPLLK